MTAEERADYAFCERVAICMESGLSEEDAMTRARKALI